MSSPSPEEPGRIVVVVEDDAVLLARMVELISGTFTVVPFSSVDELAESGVESTKVAVVVLGPSQVHDDVLEQVGALLRSRIGLGAVAVVAELSAAIMRLALRAGIDDALPVDDIDEQLLATVTELTYRLVSEAASVQRSAPAVRTEPEAASADAVPLRGRVTTVFSPKGGVGKSVVSVNLAAALARRGRGAVVIVDADLQFGDISVMLRLQPVHSIAEAAAAADGMDAVLLRSLLARHQPSGVFVLAAPAEPSVADGVSPKAMSRLISVLRGMAAHIIIDTPPQLDDLVLQLVAESDDIAFVVGMDVPSVKNARLGLQVFDVVQIPVENVLVVLNRADSKVHLGQRDIEKTLQMKVDITLPSDALVPQSVNKGVPAVLEYERSRFAGSIQQLAELIIARAGSEVAK